jgi:thioredoxin-like negative regulator of GroEL
MLRSAVLAGLLLVACGKARDDAGRADPAQGSAGVARPGDPCAKAEPHGALPWIADDYPAALACARARGVPLVLDLWAPWCHTCISMQTTVFTDPSLAARQSQFVFAMLDTDREPNAAAVGRFALSAWPTFYVVGTDEQVLARFVGAATLDQFGAFLDAGARAAKGGIAVADARLLGAERALAQRDLATADEELTAALAVAPPGWPRRAEALGSLLLTLRKRDEVARCVELADANLDAVGQSAIATNFWSTAIDCARKRASDDPQRARQLHERAIARLQQATDNADAPLSIDDRAEALGYLRDAQDALGRRDDARATAERLRVLVDDAYAKAPTPFARMTFIWPRAEVYAWLDRPLDLVADYEQLAAALPREYDPAARLGWLYLKAGKHAEAAQWTDKALALVYGPRKGRLLAQRAEIAAAADDRAAERRYREQAVALWESLPDGQKSPENLAKAKAALAALDAGSRSGSP